MSSLPTKLTRSSQHVMDIDSFGSSTSATLRWVLLQAYSILANWQKFCGAHGPLKLKDNSDLNFSPAS